MGATRSKKPVAGNPKWDLTEAAYDDPLLTCLETLTKLLGQPTSGSALKAGLPLENGLLTPALFVRAAARANLSAKLAHKKLTDIPLTNEGALLN